MAANSGAIGSGRVLQINVSNGGVPKLPIAIARVGRYGIEGDAHNDLTVHGGPHRAVCLFGIEAIERLQAEGHPIGPGGAGENLTTTGVEWSLLPVGTRALIGDEVELELSGGAGPCETIRANFSDERFSRMSINSHPSDSRMYARVLRWGHIRSGDPITLLPPAPGSRAVEEMMLVRLDRAEMKSSVAAWRAAAEAGYKVAVMEDGDLAAAASVEIPGPAFNYAFGLPVLPNMLSMLTDFYDAHGTTGWLAADAPPWPGASASSDQDTFAADPAAVEDRPAPAGVVVRQIEVGEVAAYNAVHSGNVTAGGVAAGGPNPWPQVYERLVASNNRLLFVAELDGQPVANASLHVSARTGWLRGALVAPEARGRGIQRALILARARVAAERGCDLIGSQAEPGGLSARNLENMGLRRIGQRGHYKYTPGSMRP